MGIAASMLPFRSVLGYTAPSPTWKGRQRCFRLQACQRFDRRPKQFLTTLPSGGVYHIGLGCGMLPPTMRIKFTSLSLLVLAISAVQAQQPAITRVSQHQMGESFQEWLAINQLDLPEICRPHKSSESKDMDFKTVCKSLSGIRDRGKGKFFLGDATIKQAFGWTFANGKLDEVSTEYSKYSMDEQVMFLEQSYGAPSTTETVPYQNAYGAKWDCLVVTWRMPDGVIIRAAETIRNLELSGPTRWLTVTFYAKNRMDSLIQNQKPNPYGR
jgi:hypothetical protein